MLTYADVLQELRGENTLIDRMLRETDQLEGMHVCIYVHILCVFTYVIIIIYVYMNIHTYI